MKNFTKLLAIGVMVSPILASAQVNVTTATTKRVAVLEEYTGNYCTFCPDGHKRADQIEATHGNNVITLKIQTGGFAGTDPIFGGNLKTTTGETIVSHFSSSISGYPSGSVNRASGMLGIGRDQWAAKVNEIVAQNSPVNVHVESAIDVTTRELTIDVEYYYTADEANSTNYLHIGYYQDNIPAYQYNSNTYYPARVYMSEIELYEFDHCFRDNLTPTPSSGTWGDLISSTTTGSTAIVSKTITLPASFSTFAVEPGAIKVFAYISRTSKGEIITGAKKTPTYNNFPETDNVGIIYALAGVDEKCVGSNGSSSPKILFGNRGGDNLTSFSYEYGVNGSNVSNTWNGNIANSEKRAMTLPSTNFEYIASNSLNVDLSNPNGNTDEDNSDNSLAVPFTGSTLLATSQYIRVDAKVDQYGAAESSWRIRNEAGQLIASSGKLENSKVNSKLVVLPDGVTDCYQFELIDTYGDGWGSGNYLRVFKTDAGVNELIMNVAANGNWARKTAAGEFTNTLSLDENTRSSLKLYPNPVVGDATLEFSVTTSMPVVIEVMNTLGQKVIVKSLGNVSGNQRISLESSQLESGMYFVNLKIGDNVVSKKLTVTK
jgi:hypothetical protein